jgi:two-component system, cell cycle sensor histidine kinase and response regulator CckA
MGDWFTGGLLVLAAALLAVAYRRSIALRRTMAAREELQSQALALFEGSPIASWVFEYGSLRFLEVNDAALRQYGYTREQFQALTLKDLRVEGEWATLDGLLADPGADLPAQMATHKRNGGALIQVQVHSRPVTYRGRPARLAQVEDITARLGTERALRQSEAEFRAMADASPAGIAMMTPDGGVRYLNDTALRLLGMPFERALGGGWVDACHPEDRERLLSAWSIAAAARRNHVDAGRFLHPDGRVFWWRMRTSPVWSGDVCLGHVAVIVDETEQRAAEEALRESEERFRQLAEHIPAVVYLVEPRSGSMLFISPAYERIWGRTRASLYANPFSFLDAVHEDDRERVSAAYRERLTRLDMEYRITTPDGDLVWIEDLQFPIRRADGSIYLVAGLAFDVTRRMRLEHRLIESQKMESLGRLAGGVAHDFNNLLTVILSYAELLKDTARTLSSPDELVFGLSEIENAGQRAAGLTRQLLTFARRQMVDPRVVDLNAHVVAADGFIRHLVGRQVLVTIAPEALVPAVRLDANQLDQVIMNLVSNARDAMPDGGTLRIETANVRGPVPGTAVPAGDFVALRVRDTGRGIPAENRAQVFDPFFTTKPQGQGTGLGLSTSYGIVTQFGGHMELVSQVGRGTTVTCYFPAASASVELVVDSSPVTSSPAGSETVLVVEDEPMVRDVARATLQRQGYEVVTATNGVEGLQVAEEVGARLSLVVTDVVMPQMGGWEMAALLRKRRPDVKILFTSGYNEEIANAHGRVDEGIEFLPKPYLPAVLTQRVRQVLDTSPPGDRMDVS